MPLLFQERPFSIPVAMHPAVSLVAIQSNAVRLQYFKLHSTFTS